MSLRFGNLGLRVGDGVTGVQDGHAGRDLGNLSCKTSGGGVGRAGVVVQPPRAKNGLEGLGWDAQEPGGAGVRGLEGVDDEGLSLAWSLGGGWELQVEVLHRISISLPAAPQPSVLSCPTCHQHIVSVGATCQGF